MTTITPFENQYKKLWDEVVLHSANGHFMFFRDYMDYHSDRFEDSSFMVFKDKTCIAVLPGCKQGAVWSSHGGLTFGGLILLPKHNRITTICEIYDFFFQDLKNKGFTSAFIKPTPWIYHTSLCQGEIYALSRYSQTKQYVEVTTTVDLKAELLVSTLRKRMQKKALQANLSVYKSCDYETFWEVLSVRLESKYESQPVHSINEIKMLASRFPENIHLYTVVDEDKNCLGGSVIFSTNTLWHAQYIAANANGRDLGALDLLFLYLIKEAKNQGKHYFDFGISTENNGQYLNEALISFKEGFGGRSVVHQKIEIGL